MPFPGSLQVSLGLYVTFILGISPNHIFMGGGQRNHHNSAWKLEEQQAAAEGSLIESLRIHMVHGPYTDTLIHMCKHRLQSR